MSDKVKRKELAQFLNVTPDSSATYVLIGLGAEEVTKALNYDVNSVEDVTGVSDTTVARGTPETAIDTFYIKSSDDLSDYLENITEGMLEGDDLLTDMVTVKTWLTATEGEYPAKKENVYMVPQSYGGNKQGVNSPYTIYHTNNIVDGTFNPTTKTFTPAGG